MPETSVKEMCFDVVIAGGGFGGAYCGKYLPKYLGANSFSQVALIADQNVLAFQPMLAEVVGASLSPLDVVTPLHEFCRGTNVLCGRIAAVDLQKKSLSLDAGRFTPNSIIHYKHLVLALGGVIDVSRVPGMSEHGYVLKNAWDAVRLRMALLDRLEEANMCADEAIKKRLLTFVIVGGGYSGVETAGQILDLVREIKKFYYNLVDIKPRVVLIHSREHLLPEIGPKLGIYAEDKLRQRGMEIMLNARVTAVTSARAYLGDGTFIDTHTVISTIGNAPHPLLSELIKTYNLENLKGRITTEPDMRVKNQEGLWAIGDCAAIPLGAEPSCPPTAQFALRQGMQVSGNIDKALKGKPLKPFRYKSQGELAAIGHRIAVANIQGFKFSGFFAWLIWRAIYVSKLPGLQRKLRVLVEWVMELFFPRDISMLRSEKPHTINNLHVEKGNVLLHEGDPYYTFFIIKAGQIDCFQKDTLVRTLGPGDGLGGLRDTDMDHWTIRAVAAGPGNLVTVNRMVFQTLMQSKDFAQRFPEAAQALQAKVEG